MINRHSPVMTPDFVLSRIQHEHRAWADRNFPGIPAWQPLLGMTEEYGEACESMGDKAAYLDAIADFSIFFLHYCRIKEWSIEELWAARLAHHPDGRPWPQLLGRLAHHELKSAQRIRGSQAEHDAAGRAYAASLLRHLEHVCSQMGVAYVEVVAKVWDEEVSKREWRVT